MIDLKNNKNLIIVESPNKCKTIDNILKKAGFKHTRVIASVGHIAMLKDARNSYKNTGIYPKEDFKANFQLIEDKQKLIEELKTQVKWADNVFLMTDGDREGAFIAASLIKFLKIPKDKYKRITTHEITPKAILSALENPIPLEQDLISAAECRTILDKLIGYSLSPIAKTYLGAKSVGRCQSTGLKLVIEREDEINNFKPEIYYNIIL